MADPNSNTGSSAPGNPNVTAPPVEVQILGELRLISLLLQQGFLIDDNLDTLRQEIWQTIPIVKI